MPTLLLTAVRRTRVEAGIAPAESIQGFKALPYTPRGENSTTLQAWNKEGATVRSLLSADHLLLIELAGQDLQRWLDDPAPEAQHQVKRRLCSQVSEVSKRMSST